jgi:hypothetical protein
MASRVKRTVEIARRALMENVAQPRATDLPATVGRLSRGERTVVIPK